MKLVLILLLVSSCNRTDTSINKIDQLHVTFRNSYISCNKINWKDKGYTLTDCDMEVKEVINATNIIIYE
jgi:hypothetical protein